MQCFCVCVAGQTRRRSEEEQGDEGGSLSVDEWSRRAEREKQRDWEFDSVGIKKTKGNETSEDTKENNSKTA